MAELHVIQDFLQVRGIYKCVACTGFIDNDGFNSLKDVGFIDGDMGMLEMANFLASRAVATCVNLGTVQIKRLRALVWWVHDI